MKNPIDRGPLMAPADGEFPTGGKKIEFKSKKVKREATSAEKQEIRENQRRLVALWREDGIKWRSQENEGRIRPTKEDIDALEFKKSQFAQRRISEDTAEEFGQPLDRIAEAMVLELLDKDGKTKPYVSQRGPKVIREGYNLLQDEGITYFPSEIDDYTNGTDAILMLADPEEGDSASALSIDLTLDPQALLEKRRRDLMRINENGEDLKSIYWYDSRIKTRGEPPRKAHELYKPGERFSDPKEGKIKTINISVFIPDDLVKAFGSKNSTFEQAHEAMERLGPYVLNQMKVELSEMALRALGMIRQGAHGLEIIRLPDLDEVLSKLEELENSPRGKGRSSVTALRRALSVVYHEEEELIRRNLGMRREDAMRPASQIPGFNGFRNEAMAAE